MEAVGQDMFNLAIGLRDFDMFEAMDIMLFDQRDNFIGAKVEGLFGDGMDESDGAVDFGFSDEN